MKLEKISNIVLLSLVVVSLVTFGLFFFVGFDQKIEETSQTAPKFTDLLIYVQYALFAITAIAMVFAFVYNAMKSSGGDVKAQTGLPANKIFYGVIAFMIASLVIGYVLGMGDSQPIMEGDEEKVSGFMVNITEMFLWSIYILSGAAFIAVGVSLSGILKK